MKRAVTVSARRSAPRVRASRAKPPVPRRQPGPPRVFPVVGIGASAGGLDAFKTFFSAMPADSGAAFVLIQHLDPTRESLTAELVGTYTTMPVVQVTDRMPVESNRVYVIPPNAYLAIRKRTLRLSPPSAPRGLRMAVDFFLRALATDQQEHAVGVILSGTGTDGTLGLQEIEACGGMTMVQEPRTAQHDGMPRSAIASGCADYILPAEQMADAVLAYVQHVAMAGITVPGPRDQAADSLAAVIAVLWAQTKFDFTGYKKGTLRRRIQRRMGLRCLTQLPEYVEVLRADAAEVAALFKDLLINVTSFFREPAAWRVLQEQVIRRVVAAKTADAPLRVWIPACATGEEAYSIAIVLLEELETTGKACRLQVFASDVDADALETARTGVYPEGIAAHVSPERLARFFVRSGHAFRVSKALRETVVFAQQSLTSDPPFSRLDLISCRNLFIYLEPAVQAQLLPLLHFALLDGGYLFLGSAEGIGVQEDLFEAVSTKWRIYRRIGSARRDRLQLPLAAPLSTAARGATPRVSDPVRLAAMAQSLLLRRYAPACVVVNRAGEIIFFHGRTDDYLMQPAGVPTQDLLAQARSGLRTALRDALRSAIRDHQRVVHAGVQMRRGRGLQRVTVVVEPLNVTSAEGEGLWLVSLEDDSEVATVGAHPDVGTAPDAGRVRQLEHELTSTREDLQQTIENLRAANEELMSLNEEFQSSNEELETSKEELQSLNEELTAANTQLENKIGELESANNDLDNLLTSTNIATLFLDTQLRIRRYTPAATTLFSLIPSDIGRPLRDIAQQFTDRGLAAAAASVLREPTAPKADVQGHDGRWYVRQVLPYRTREGRIEGVVITFSDVAAEAIQEARLYAESIVETVREPLLVLDEELRVRSANQAFYAAFHAAPEATVGQRLYALGDRQFDAPALRRGLGEVVRQRRVLDEFELEATFPPIGRRTLQINARVLTRGGDRPELILLAIDDVTDRRRADESLREVEHRKHAEDQLRQRQAELAHALRISTVGELASGLAHELNQPLSAIVNGVEACARYVRSGKGGQAKLLGLLNDASGEALRAAKIVEHLRLFIEKGRPQFERTDLCEVARNLPRLLGRELQQLHITLQLDLPPRPLPVDADPIQIEQVIVNLMQNAVDALRDAAVDGREIHLQVRAAKGIATVSVHDTGSGVSPADKERMFDPFVSTKPNGLGMGLAISRSIIEAHRGRLRVERRPRGEPGTTATFTLPLPPARKAAAP